MDGWLAGSCCFVLPEMGETPGYGLVPELPAAPNFCVLSHLSAEGCRFVWVYNKTPRNCRQSLDFHALLPMATSLGSGGLLGMTSEEQ